MNSAALFEGILFVLLVILIVCLSGAVLWQQRQLRRQLGRSETLHDREYRTLVASSPVGIFTTRASGRVVEVNGAMAEMLGSANPEAFQEAMPDIRRLYRYPEQRELFLDALRAQGKVRHFEFEGIRLDGTPLWMELNASILEWSVDGDFLITGFLTDISVRKASEQGLRNNNERFRQLFADLDTVAVQGCQPDGTVVYWNRGSEKLFGYARGEVMGRPLPDLLFPPETRGELTSQLLEMRERGCPGRPEEVRLLRKDGSPVSVFAHHALVHLPGIGTELYCISVDLTERKRHEEELVRLKESLTKANWNLERALAESRQLATQAEASNLAKSRFLANMTHEVRTPMNGIIGMTDILLDMGLPPEQASCAETIRACGLTLLNLIMDVLDLSELESGGVGLEEVPFSIEELVSACEEVSVKSGQTRTLNFIHDIDSRIPELVMGDRGKLQRVLLNLLNNAGKFSHEAGGTVFTRIHLHSRYEDKVVLHCEVEDEGIGIPESFWKEAFEPFHMVDDTPHRHEGGRGLGLSIVRRLIELMGGEVGLRSTPGAGTVVHFNLTLKLPVSQYSQEDREPLTPRQVPLSVLLVEDNPGNQKVARLLLERSGCRVEIAANGLEALELLSKADFDLCLMDLQMPKMDGLKAAMEIRSGKHGVRNPHVPIVALTARVLGADREACLRVGMNDYIPKPIELRAFHHSLNRLGILETTQ